MNKHMMNNMRLVGILVLILAILIGCDSEGGGETTPAGSGNFLYAWGDNAGGQLGTGNITAQYASVKIGDKKWKQVSAGSAHTIAIDSDDHLFAWGGNSKGQLGIGNETDQTTPVQVVIGEDTTKKWKQVSAGSAHTIAIDSDDHLFAWGFNIFGQLGNGNTNNQNAPVKIGTDTWKQVSAGAAHTIAIMSDGLLYAWGYNGQGQLGNGDTTDQHAPVKIEEEKTNWKQISAGGRVEPFSNSYVDFTIAIDDVGKLYAWGDNSYGQLGIGIEDGNDELVNHSTPFKVGTRTWSQVSAGDRHTVAIDNAGVLYAWGHNGQGRLGNGNTDQQNTPVAVGIGTDTTKTWKQVSAGGTHTVAIDSNDYLFAWGYNLNGQLGSGNIDNKTAPVKIGTQQWTFIDAGYSHTIGIIQ